VSRLLYQAVKDWAACGSFSGCHRDQSIALAFHGSAREGIGACKTLTSRSRNTGQPDNFTKGF